MPHFALRTNGLGKRYRIGASPVQFRSIREVLVHAVTSPVRNLARLRSVDSAHARDARATIWALDDVSFEVGHGEVLGVVGRNGAGKSTLLKILSRITQPTRGRADVYGRVGSLLEVGTGFHSELSGRDNIYLNGSILGMDRAYITRRFDDIVEFAGVGEFVDTPVKHYSTGMYMRLAFAVAAHLEPEILVVDEVLAVGDAEFQKKCLSKMGDVAVEGRTVLFVSHNLNAVQRLCTRCIMLEHGKLVADASTPEVVGRYLASGADEEATPARWIDVSRASHRGPGGARFVRVWYSSDSDAAGFRPYPMGPLEVRMEIVSDARRRIGSLAFTIYDQSRTKLVNADTIGIGRVVTLREGVNHVRLNLERLYLNPGIYIVGLWIADSSAGLHDEIDAALRIEVVDVTGPGMGVRPGDDGAVPCQFDVSELDVEQA